MSLENLTIVGCSAHGREAVRYLVPLLTLTRKALLVVPHIRGSSIYDDLDRLGVQVESIDPVSNSQGGEVDFKRGKAYILGGNWPNLYSRDGVSFSVNGHRISAIDEGGANLDPVMCQLAQIFRERTTGVILTGAGDDGLLGAQCISRNGGRIFAQKDSPKSKREFEPWGYSDGMPRSVIENAKVDFAGTLSELVDAINRDL